jgi:serine/threonine-protein kinase HipA
MSTKELAVLINSRVIGKIEQIAQGKFRFLYEDIYRTSESAIPLSLSMPLTASEHSDDVVRPFIWGLLPDNHETLNYWGRRFNVSPNNPFAILGHVGEDLPGAVQTVPPDRLDDLKRREGITRLSQKVLTQGFAELMRMPGATQFTTEGGQFSLAGAQRKKALCLVNGKWYEPRGRTPSTHILKPSIDGYPGQVENEMLCLRLAPRLGLPAPKCWIEHFGDVKVIVVERYDRRRFVGARLLPLDSAGGQVRRVHQEDCCQALGVDPRKKYQKEGGPNIARIMALLSASSRPSEDRDRFLRACAYNFVLLGTDAHAKNYSLLLARQGRFRLAPLYDIISWLPYSTGPKSDALAMSIAGKYVAHDIMPRHWEAEAKRSGFDGKRALAHIKDIVARLPEEMQELLELFDQEGISNDELKKLGSLLAERCLTLARTYGAEPMSETQRRLPGI